MLCMYPATVSGPGPAISAVALPIGFLNNGE